MAIFAPGSTIRDRLAGLSPVSSVGAVDDPEMAGAVFKGHIIISK